MAMSWTRLAARLCLAVMLSPALAALTPAMAAEMDDDIFWSVQFDELEYRAQQGHDVGAWEASAWIGNDDHRLKLTTEGERESGGVTEGAEFQLLYKRPVSDFFDLELGARHDLYPRPQRSYAVLGLEGLAPQWFEVDGHAFLSEEGDVSARFEVEYDVLLTQRLVLQPSAELNLAASGDRAIGAGSGIQDIELGLRLRYEVVRKFAPYVGLNWERLLGQTEDWARQDGEDRDSFALVAGLRFWF